MFSWFKNIFISSPSHTKETPPGRTFKRILTNEYFGLANTVTNPKLQKEAQERKITQINEHNLLPIYVTYHYEHKKIIAAKVAFQKEEHAKKWNMIHITEISFLLYLEDFKDFEVMTKTNLKENFIDVTPEHIDYEGIERRKNVRDLIYA